MDFRWPELRSNLPSGDDLATIPVGTKSSIAAAMDRYGDLHLLIAVEDGPPDHLPCDLNGLTIRPRMLLTGSVIDLKAPASHESVFSALCAEIVTAVGEHGRSPWPAVLATVKDWQSAWRPRQPPMEKTVQVGLYGELWVLQEILLPVIGPRAVDMWSGADRERHDFCGRLVEIEVKTTRKRAPVHEISQLDQLWRTEGKQLLLVSVGVEESIGGTDDIAKRIAGVKAALGKDLAAHDQFSTQLYRYGWDEAVTTSGHLVRFNFRHGWLFRVDEKFPRFAENYSLPSGVGDVRYSVSVANLPQLDTDTVTALLKEQM
jgi:hypothetical protein